MVKNVKIEKQIKDNIQILINKGEIERAEILLNEYMIINKNDVEIYSIKAVILMTQNKFNEAENVLKEGLWVDGENFDLLFNLGYLNECRMNYIEAKAIYNIARVTTKSFEEKEIIRNKMCKLGYRLKKYNVILVGNYATCKKIKNDFDEWNIVAICSEEYLAETTKISDLKKYDFDFIFIVERVNKREIYDKFGNFNNWKVYFMQDFEISVIEGLDYKISQLINKKNIDGIITGLSYAEVGIQEHLLFNNFSNFAFSAQDLYYDFLLLKYLYNFKEVKKSLKYVIINLAYYSFDYDMTKTISKYRIHRYNEYIPNNHNNNDKIGINITKAFYEKRITFNDYIRMDKAKKNKIINKEDDTGRYEAERNSSMNYTDTRKENKFILEEYLSFLKERKIKPILVVCPTSIYYRCYFDYRKKDLFYNILNNLNKKYEFQLIDYFESDLFLDEDFWDYSHLNYNGAKKFTSILNDEIEWEF